MSRAELEEARLLLRKAQEDAAAVDKLASDSEIADSVVGFHAQQAAEKALKAVLTTAGDDFPWTHDLRYLVERIQAAGKSLPESIQEIHTLGPWAVEFRYGETIDDPLDRDQAVRLTTGVVAWAHDQIDASVQRQGKAEDEPTEADVG